MDRALIHHSLPYLEEQQGGEKTRVRERPQHKARERERMRESEDKNNENKCGYYEGNKGERE